MLTGIILASAAAQLTAAALALAARGRSAISALVYVASGIVCLAPLVAILAGAGWNDVTLPLGLDGARHAGLHLDGGPHSRIFELRPDYTEFLESSPDPGAVYQLMNFLSATDRQPGPTTIDQVSVSARRRWLENAANLKDKRPYRPKTLDKIASELNALDPQALGVGAFPNNGSAPHELYVVEPGDTLRALAKRFYGDVNASDRIFAANRDKLESPDRIYAGQSLRVPT